jgi:hypothetical protein
MEFRYELQGFISDIFYIRCGGSQDEPATLPSITAAQCCGMDLVTGESDKVFDVGCFPGSPKDKLPTEITGISNFSDRSIPRSKGGSLTS